MDPQNHPLRSSPPVDLDPADRPRLLEFARRIGVEAGAVVTPHFRNQPETQNKLDDGDYDPVTVADRAAEKLLRERIAAAHPEHGVFGEEFGHQPGNGLTWVLDPIDGTRAFISGFLHWGLLIALDDGREPVLGVLHQPFLGETFSGDGDSAHYERTGSSREAQRLLRTRSCANLAEATIGTTHPGCFPDPGDWRRFEALAGRCRMLRYGGDCYGYAMVAMGQLDLVVETALNAYDIQALIPIVRGAGGVITSWDGGDPSLGGSAIAAGDPRVHEQALEILQAVR